MNVLCVYFPRLPVQATMRSRPQLAGRELVLVTGAGEDALVTATTNGPARDGVVTGMRAADARQLSPRSAFVPGGIAASLDILESAAALTRARVTPLVEIGGPDCLYAGVAPDEEDAPLLAARVRALISSWTGLQIRVGLGGSREAALAAARCARDGIAIDELPTSDSGRPITAWRPECVDAVVTLASPADATRAARRLAAVLAARDEGWRTIHIEGPRGALATWRTAEPVYESDRVEELLRSLVRPDSAGVPVRITLGGLVPDLRVKPYLGGARHVAAALTGVQPPQPRFLPHALRAAS